MFDRRWCPACEVHWLGPANSRCWSCGAASRRMPEVSKTTAWSARHEVFWEHCDPDDGEATRRLVAEANRPLTPFERHVYRGDVILAG